MLAAVLSECGLLALVGVVCNALYYAYLTSYSQGEAARARASVAAEARTKSLQAEVDLSAGLSQLLEITRLLNARLHRSSARGVELALRGLPWEQERPAYLWTAADVAAWLHASGWRNMSSTSLPMTEPRC